MAASIWIHITVTIAALSARLCRSPFVVKRATRSALPLRLAADPEQKCGGQLIPPMT